MCDCPFWNERRARCRVRDGDLPPSAAPQGCPWRDTFWWAWARLDEEWTKLKSTLFLEVGRTMKMTTDDLDKIRRGLDKAGSALMSFGCSMVLAGVLILLFFLLAASG